MSGRRGDSPAAPVWAGILLAALSTSCAASDHPGRQIRYICNDGTRVTIYFRGDAALLTGFGTEPMRLTRRGGAFSNESPMRSARLQGGTLTLIVGRMAPISCLERR